MIQYEKIKEIVASMEADVEKSDSGNKSAGTRVRKALMEIKNLAHEGRKIIVGAGEANA